MFHPLLGPFAPSPLSEPVLLPSMLPSASWLGFWIRSSQRSFPLPLQTGKSVFAKTLKTGRIVLASTLIKMMCHFRQNVHFCQNNDILNGCSMFYRNKNRERVKKSMLIAFCASSCLARKAVPISPSSLAFCASANVH